MRVVFIEDVPGVAMAGEVKKVADGYGRNYLIPRKLAVLATPMVWLPLRKFTVHPLVARTSVDDQWFSATNASALVLNAVIGDCRGNNGALFNGRLGTE